MEEKLIKKLDELIDSQNKTNELLMLLLKTNVDQRKILNEEHVPIEQIEQIVNSIRESKKSMGDVSSFLKEN